MTETLSYRQLRRSRSDRMLAGVSGGLAAYFDVNPVFYRVGFVVLALLGGAGIVIYAVCALVIPDDGRDDSIVEAAIRDRRERPWRLVGLALVGIAALALVAQAHVWPSGDVGWALVLLAGIALLAFGPGLRTRRAERRTGDRPRSFAITTAVLGVLVIGAGILGALAAAGVDVPWAIALAIAAGAVGVALVVGAILHLRVGGLVVLGLLLGAAAILASTVDLRLGDGIGQRSYAPLTAAGLRSEYKLGVGELDLDLGRLALPPGETVVHARLGVGQLSVTVPNGVALRVASHVGWGDSVVLGKDQSGHAVDDTTVRPGPANAPTLVLDTHVGAGQLEVVRAVR
jgi:phage shock protein PspC (stress-responsive transcriptional regulator)